MSDDLAAIFRACDLPPGEILSGDLSGTSETLATKEEVSQKLKLPGYTGWICFADKVMVFTKDTAAEWPGESEKLGPILSAELYHAREDTSLHVRQQGDKWRLVTWEKNAPTSGTESWLLTRSFLAADPAQRNVAITASYEVCWQPAPDFPNALEPAFSRFVGFSPTNF